MQINRLEPEQETPIKRIFIASAVLPNFKGHKNVEVQLFRNNADENELASLREKNLVSTSNPDLPREVLAGASEDAALRCLQEAFTEEECTQLIEYLSRQYADQISRIDIAPLPLPLPLGLGPLANLPEGERSGFIKFSRSKDYNLPFELEGWYDLDENDSHANCK